METHICPKCSQPCAYKSGIMCTITGCIKDGTASTNNSNDGGFSNLFNTIFGQQKPSNPFADILNRYKKTKL